VTNFTIDMNLTKR